MIFPDLLVLLLLPAVLSAAPIPADHEKLKPRPRLTGTLSLPVHVDVALWHPDSKHLILRCSDGIVRVIRRDQFGNDEPTGKPKSELKLPPRSQHIALSPEGSELYSIVTSGGG